MSKKWFVAFVLSQALFADTALSNGVISEFPAGGVAFRNSADISIAREDLFLSMRQVRVHYVYQSDASEPQTQIIGFPMPAVPIDQSPDHLGGLEPNEVDTRNYMRFQVSVDHRPVKPILHEYALLGDKDITETLKAMGLTPLMVTEEDRRRLIDLPVANRDLLAKSGLVDFDDSGNYAMPLWNYKVVYEWEQSFRPGTTDVEITYVPLTGYPSDIGASYEVGPGAEKACVSDELLSEVRNRKANGRYYEIINLGYVLTTANYWKGPIGLFNLVVDAEDIEAVTAENLVSLCFGGQSLPPAARYQFSVSDFTPSKDLGVVFYTYPVE